MDEPSTSCGKPFRTPPGVQCFVPRCRSNSTRFPNKQFLAVPKEPMVRNLWLEVAGTMLPADLYTSNIYCCDDHFDQETDMETLIGVFPKKGVVPHRFDCQRPDFDFTAPLDTRRERVSNIMLQMCRNDRAPEPGDPQNLTMYQLVAMQEDELEACIRTALDGKKKQEVQAAGISSIDDYQKEVKQSDGVLASLPEPLARSCTTCLSADRSLYSLRNAPQLLNVCNGIDLDVFDVVCFECFARLKSFQRFRSRTLQARQVLATHAASATQMTRAPLSSLVSVSLSPDEHVLVDGDLVLVKHEPEPEAEEPLPLAVAAPLEVPRFDADETPEPEPMGLEETDEAAGPSSQQEAVGAAPAWAAGAVDEDVDSDTDTASETNEPRSELYNSDFSVSRLDVSQVLAHMEATRREDKFRRARHKCVDCALVFFSERHHRMHMQMHDVERGKLKCIICQQRFGLGRLLKLHLETHFKRYECLRCFHVEYTYKKIYAHHRTAHDDTVRRCPRCKDSFTKYADLRRHIRLEHRTAHTCTLCTRTFVNNAILQRHILMSHTKVDDVECEFCHKKYKGEFNLKKHIQDAHKNDQEPDENAYCAECDMQFPTIHRYRNHLRNASKHFADKALKFECDYCGKKCKEKASLRTHIEVMHLKIKRYDCDVCHESFITMAYMKHHKRQKHRAAPRVKKYVCHLCEKAFTVRKSLDEHANTHLGIRPFQCRHCDATFSYSAALYNHTQLVHLKQKVGRNKNT